MSGKLPLTSQPNIVLFQAAMHFAKHVDNARSKYVLSYVPHNKFKENKWFCLFDAIRNSEIKKLLSEHFFPDTLTPCIANRGHS